MADLEINGIGLREIENFLLLNHTDAYMLINNWHLFNSMIEGLEKQYRDTGKATLAIDSHYVFPGGDAFLLLLDSWFDPSEDGLVTPYEYFMVDAFNPDPAEDTRIGINDKIDPELKSKRICDW